MKLVPIAEARGRLGPGASLDAALAPTDAAGIEGRGALRVAGSV